MGVDEREGVFVFDGRKRGAMEEGTSTAEKNEEAFTEECSLRHTAKPASTNGTRTVAKSVELSDAYDNPVESTRLPQFTDDPEIIATRSPEPTSPVNSSITKAPSTTEPTRLTSEEVAGDMPPVRVDEVELTNERSFAALYMNH